MMAPLKYPPGAHSDIQLYAHVRNLFSRLNTLCIMHDTNFNPTNNKHNQHTFSCPTCFGIAGVPSFFC